MSVHNGFDRQGHSVFLKQDAVLNLSLHKGAFGTIKDLENFYCLSLNAATNQLVLWKKMDGRVVRLRAISQILRINELYNLRIEVLGDLQRVYFNDTCVMEVTDNAFAEGQLAINSYISDVEYTFGKFSSC